MSEIQLGIVESRFADLIWAHVPVTTSELVHLAAEAFDWKRTTTHTVIKRLCDKGLFENNGGTVSAKLSRDDFYAMQSKQYVENTFQGSLPAFIAAFTKAGSLSAQEAAEIRRMIDKATED